ncbi:hypothetical protein HG531_008102 [Fusarium graminearum]|nr:hypothetical protein HG531_008102 [Fusarium graminearum]
MAVSNLDRVCLVTVGATAGFKTLIDSVLSVSYWQYIVSQGFTELHVQCGPDAASAKQQLTLLQDEIPSGLTIEIFDVKKNLMKEEMILCKDLQGQRQLGLVISHAGTGTILDAWKMGLPIVVVPNTELLDDHQAEMAKHLSKEGYAIISSGSTEDLKEAIHKVGLLWEENQTRWPPHKIPSQEPDRLRLWDLAPVDVAKEENATMAHDYLESHNSRQVLDAPYLHAGIASCTCNLATFNPGHTIYTVLMSISSFDALALVLFLQAPNEDVGIETTAGSVGTCVVPGNRGNSGSVSRPAVCHQLPASNAVDIDLSNAVSSGQM